MRLLLGADTYPPDVNGAARFTERLALGMLGRGHEVHVLCPSITGARGVEERDGIVVHRMRSHRWPLYDDFHVCLPWEIHRDVVRTVAKVRPHVVHTQAHFVTGRCLVRTARHRAIPLVATNHLMPENLVDQTPIPAPLARLFARLVWQDIGRVFRHADVVTAPTPRAVALLEDSTGLTGARAVSCGIDPAPYAAAARATPRGDVPTILFVGRLDPEKRVGELLDAVAGLPSSLPCRVEIVGDGSMRAPWQEQAERLGLAGRVLFHGFVEEPELLAAYGRADVFVMPGVAELQSLVTLEAMSAGKPVVAADAMALPHLVHPGRNGWLYTPGDVGELTLRLATLLGDPGLRRRMGAAGQEIVRRHALASTLDTFIELYAVAARRVTGQPETPQRRVA